MPKVDAIYIFCGNQACHESWSKDWPKIRGVFISIKPICESLKKVAGECDHDSIPMSFVPKQTMTKGATGSDEKSLDQLPPSYMHSAAKNSQLWEVPLTITGDNDPQLAGLTGRIKVEIDGRGWQRMATLMLKVGHFNQAEELYNELLENASNDRDRAHIYHILAMMKTAQGKYPEAIKFYEESLEIHRKTLREDDISLANTYNNIGVVYNNMDEYSKALEFYEKSHKIQAISLPKNHPDLAFPYNWLGRIYRSMKEYSKALSYFQKSISIREQALPEKHPNRAVTYSDIGDVHRLMGDHEKALGFHKKALNIQENVKCNPLECATTYMNLGEPYREMKDYTTALTYYQKGLKICEDKLAKSRPDSAIIYHNTSKLYFSTQKYSTVMKYVLQAVEIGQ
ncbi:unnamed protein product [Rotaria socialis]|uniref:Kinesin light chain n=1 Tax=Rotaria socialis TaxID=392032 RepID=A0A820WKR2_9BILA|nr:unnamed protein product [Rotaria socialis]